MPSAALRADLRRLVTGLVTRGKSDLIQVWNDLDTAQADITTAALLRTVPRIVERYGEIGAALTADWYDRARAEAGARRTFIALGAEPAGREQTEAMTRWAVTPLWSETPAAGLALTNLTAGVERLIRQPPRGTIITNTGRDPGAGRWAREAVGEGCAFCLMLVSRGAVYTEETADFETHDHCSCDAVPVWDDTDVPEEAATLRDLWNEATRGESDQLNAFRRALAPA